MSKDCGISAGAVKLSEGIESAKGEIDSLIGSGVGGIADSAVNIKDKISGLTDGIGADLESMAPELPEPAFKLQDQMTNLLSNAENPTAMIQQMDEMKEKFGDKINLDKVFDDIGLDSKELNAMNADYKDKLAAGTKLKETQDKLKLKDKLAGGLGKVGEIVNSAKDSELLALASGDLTAIGNLIGGAADKLFKKSPTDMLDGVCNQVPNLEMDAAGKVIEKGIPALAPTEDAKPDEGKVDPKTDTVPVVKDQSLENIEIILDLDPTKVDFDFEPFDFGPPVDQAKLEEPTDLFAADQLKLSNHLQTLRDSQLAYKKQKREMNTVTTPNGGIDLDKEFYHRAYTKFINYFTINMEIEFNQKDPAQERALSVDEFMVRDSSFNAIPPPDKIKHIIPKNEYEQHFVNAPKNTKNQHLPLREELLSLKWIEVAGLEET